MEKFKIVKTKLDVLSIQFIENGEIMHNPIGPWEEACQLYLSPMQISKRMMNPLLKPLVIYDVGLGAGTNAVAALSLWREQGRGLKIISFEKDLDLLRFALLHKKEFAFLSPWERAIRSLLENGSWQSDRGELQWQLRYGEFDSCIGNQDIRADCIFYEPYSPKVNPEMWSVACFQRLFAQTNKNLATTDLFVGNKSVRIRGQKDQASNNLCNRADAEVSAKVDAKSSSKPGSKSGSKPAAKPVEPTKTKRFLPSEGGSLLSTYSRATAVRSALLLSGFFVGPGVGLGLKEETTLAATRIEDLPELLGERWLERVKRSHCPFSTEVDRDQWPELMEALASHPQFNSN